MLSRLVRRMDADVAFKADFKARYSGGRGNSRLMVLFGDADSRMKFSNMASIVRVLPHLSAYTFNYEGEHREHLRPYLSPDFGNDGDSYVVVIEPYPSYFAQGR